jgi:hypothetical protein
VVSLSIRLFLSSIIRAFMGRAYHGEVVLAFHSCGIIGYGSVWIGMR